MSYTHETTKRIVFVGVVFATLVLFIVACIHDVIVDDVLLDAEDVYAAMGEQSGVTEETENISSDYSHDVEQGGGTENENDNFDEVDEGYMVGASYDRLSGINISSNYCFVYNLTTNTVLYEKSAYDKCYPASVTKLLTAAVALEYVPSDTVFKVGNEVTMVGPNSSMAYIPQGQSFRLADLLYALLLPSGNDAAYTIAVNTARYLYGESLSDQEATELFMDLCNQKLLEIGAYNTHFACPDGYHQEGHYTTAYDMMLVSLYATSFEEICNVCKTYKYYCKSVEGESYGWKNTNSMLNESGAYYCEFVTGLKTGTTDEAGRCLATTAEKDGEKLYIVIFDAPNLDSRNNDTLEIIHSVFSH